MTDAQFISFIKGHLRKASRWWKPISDSIKKSRVSRGHYLCNGCKEIVTKSVTKDGKRRNNIHADHVIPVVDPEKGFTTWDDFINRLFTEQENIQILCSSCHDAKTKEERERRTTRQQKGLNE